jgi:hypothetical protein
MLALDLESEVAMRFMDIHTDMKGLDQQAFQQAHNLDTKIEDDEGVRFLHAWADPAAGKVFCLSEGPSKEAVLRVHERAGHPTEEIYEVSLEVE